MTDTLSTDRLNTLPQEPASSIFVGARVEVTRQGEWIPGVIVGLPVTIDRSLPLQIDVLLDRPDRSGSTDICTDSHKIRLCPETAAAIDRQCAEQLAELRAGLDAELARHALPVAAE